MENEKIAKVLYGLSKLLASRVGRIITFILVISWSIFWALYVIIYPVVFVFNYLSNLIDTW